MNTTDKNRDYEVFEPADDHQGNDGATGSYGEPKYTKKPFFPTWVIVAFIIGILIALTVILN